MAQLLLAKKFVDRINMVVFFYFFGHIVLEPFISFRTERKLSESLSQELQLSNVIIKQIVCLGKYTLGAKTTGDQI